MSMPISIVINRLTILTPRGDKKYECEIKKYEAANYSVPIVRRSVTLSQSTSFNDFARPR